MTRGARCDRHDLALAADGLCVLCRRQKRRRRSAATWPLVAAVPACAVLGAIVLHLTQVRPRDDVGALPVARPPETSDSSGTPARDVGNLREKGARQRGEPLAEPRRARRASRPRRPARPAAVAPPEPQASEDELAARNRMNALYQAMALEQARRQVPITMYIATWCRACSAARAWLRAKRIAYREVDVDAGPASAAELEARNPRRSIPTIDIDGQILVGFSPGAIERAIERAAARRATAL